MILSNILFTRLSDDNKSVLDRIQNEQQLPRNIIINRMIDTFCELPDAVKSDLLKYITRRLHMLYSSLETSGPVSTSDIMAQTQAYIKIAKYLNDGIMPNIDTTDNVPLTKYLMRDGYLVCPKDWIIANPRDAMESVYAHVIECRNFRKHSIPHILVFSNEDRIACGSAQEQSIYELCKSAYPRFRDVLKMQVEPVEDPDRPGVILNQQEWADSPTIGIFKIAASNLPILGVQTTLPYGARIVRTKIR